ncbi:MAG: hypothetical protein COT18_10330 [Elusimicrobia bacterium CG08_land_8_20_14_0_20_59_10]|nr:MAG: hypothetical protein COT18_10330 [Elusimicrobia bacterium CG08_land_8_20_14_0_20_59_10]
METPKTLQAREEEVIEPEIVSNGPGDSGQYDDRGRTSYSPPPQALGVVKRLKAIAAAVLALTGAGLFITGALLTSTVIGALIGIPLMLGGAAAFFLLIKLLGAGSKNFGFRG